MSSDNGGTKRGDDPALDQDTHWQQAAQRLYEPDGDGGLTAAIVFAIADTENVSPSGLTSPTAYETVDVAGIELPIARA